MEYDRLREENSVLEAKINSWKADLNNTVRIYQSFVDRNVELRKREDELALSINGLEAREAELRKTTTELQQQFTELHENNIDNVNLEIKQDDVVSTNDVSTPQVQAQVDPSFKIPFDTGNLFQRWGSFRDPQE